MRVLSKYKDFYDGMGRSDLERTPVFVRDLNEEFIRPKTNQSTGDVARMASFDPISTAILSMPKLYNETHDRDHAYLGFELDPTAVLFCGEVRYGYTVEETWLTRSDDERRFCRRDPIDDLRAPHPPVKKFLSFAEAVAEIDAWTPVTSKAKGSRAFVLRSLERSYSGFSGLPSLEIRRHNFTHGGYNAWWEEHGRRTGDFVGIHRREKTPVLSFDEDDRNYNDPKLRVVKNPPLKLLGFHKILSAQTAWQTLDQYLGNQMAEQRDPLPLDDEYRRDAHGFDDRSFKQMAPGEKKARRAARK